MEEGSRGGNDGASSSSPALLSGGGRQRFEVELRPGETTIVSWKKLVKDANKAASNNKALPVPAPPVPPTVAVNQTLNSLNAPPLDEYFQVDNSAIKHDGFFVNRGKLERTTVCQNDPAALPSQQPKKRRRKDSAKVSGGNDDGKTINLKVKDKAAGKVVAQIDKSFAISSQSKASSAINCEDIKYQNPTTALGTVVKKSSDSRDVVDYPSPTSISNAEEGWRGRFSSEKKAGGGGGRFFCLKKKKNKIKCEMTKMPLDLTPLMAKT